MHRGWCMEEAVEVRTGHEAAVHHVHVDPLRSCIQDGCDLREASAAR
jgi:hypothetical protein